MKEYFSHPALNNSLLNTLSNPKWIEWKMSNVEVEDGDKRHFRIGSAIDTLLTEPYRFDELFCIVNLNAPSGLMGKFIYYLPKGLFPPEDEINDIYLEDFKEAYEKSGYKLPIKTVVSNLWSEPTYYNFYYMSKNTENKTLLSLDEFKEVEEAVKNIRSNSFINHYFSIISDNPHIQKEFQKVIFFEYECPTGIKDYFTDEEVHEPVECKAMMDLVVWDHKEKTVRLIDLKSTGHSTYDFEEYFYSYGYFRQCAFYTLAMQHYLKSNNLDYTILPFQFIVTPKSNKGYPALIYEVSEETLNKGFSGTVRDKKLPGVYELIKDYLWHYKNKDWSARREIIEQNYKITI